MKISILENEEKDEVYEFLEANTSVPTQLPAWTDILSDLDSSIESFYLVARESGIIKGILPGFFMKTDYGAVYHSMPYPGGYGGIVSNDPIVYRKILDHLLAVANERDCVTVSIANLPWVNDYDLYVKYLRPDYIFKNFVNYIDLEKDLRFNKKIRWGIRKAEDIGVTVSREITEENLRSFYDIFEELMKGYGSSYFSYDLFEAVVNELVPANKASFLFASLDGRIIAGDLLLSHGKVIEYFHSANHTDYRKYQPNSLLLDAGIRWGKEAGYKYWNWQSTRVRGSSVHKFKLRWGCEEVFHYYFTKVTGNCDELIDTGIETIRKKYPFIYFLPIGAFSDREQTFFEK